MPKIIQQLGKQAILRIADDHVGVLVLLLLYEWVCMDLNRCTSQAAGYKSRQSFRNTKAISWSGPPEL
jgi:hypothetical protein